jgi:hypothetical protein
MRPPNRTRFTPAWPATLKRPSRRHAGETWSTAKSTRPARDKTKTKVVVRRCFEPVVAIQRRDDRKLSTRLPLGLLPSADAPEPPLDEVFEDRPPDADAAAACDSGAPVAVV